MERKTRKLFKELLKKMTLEMLGEESDLEEITSTGNAPGYSTPNAFVGKNKKKKNKNLKQALKQVGYELAEEVEDSLKLMIGEKKEEQYKPGDVWKRDGGAWAAKNSKGNIQGYKSKEDAEAWAKDEVPNKSDKSDKSSDTDTKQDDDTEETESEKIEREEKEELEKKANKGFFKSKWDDFSKKGAADTFQSAKDKGEKLGQELEKGETPDTGVASKIKDLGVHKKSQKGAQQALRKKLAKDAEKEKKKQDAEDKKVAAADKKKTKANKKKATDTTQKKKKKIKVKEALDGKDITNIKKLIRQVVADILRDLWIKRSIWKDKR